MHETQSGLHLYMRVSTSGDKTQKSQESELRVYTKQRGWTLTRVFCGPMGSQGRKIVARLWNAMMTDLAAGGK